MKIIKCLSEYIEEEIEGAGEYAKKALKIKEEYPEVADMLWIMSNEEMKHVQNLHSAVAKLIQQYRAAEGEPPEGMMAIYDYMHERQINKAAAIRALQEMYSK